MSVVYIRRLPENAMLGLWHVSESQEELLKPLELSPADFLLVNTKTDSGKKEWLACRNLLKEMLGERVEIKYDTHGKPSLAHHAFNISMSHSRKYACVYLHPAHPAGVDIQWIKPTLKAGSHFFLNEKELEWVAADNNEMLHIIWAVKEAVFKYCGISELDIKKDIVLNPFPGNQNGIIEVNILNHNISDMILAAHESFDGYILARTV
jgi:4'-phosphopantetheinyl transferase